MDERIDIDVDIGVGVGPWGVFVSEKDAPEAKHNATHVMKQNI